MKYYYLTDESEKSLSPFFSKSVLSTAFACVVIVGILVLILWPRQPVGSYIIADRVPFVFFLVFGATLIVSCYLSIYCGRGESVPRFYFIRNQSDAPTFEKEIDFIRYGLIQFVLHTLILLLPFLPFSDPGGIYLGGCIDHICPGCADHIRCFVCLPVVCISGVSYRRALEHGRLSCRPGIYDTISFRNTNFSICYQSLAVIAHVEQKPADCRFAIHYPYGGHVFGRRTAHRD